MHGRVVGSVLGSPVRMWLRPAIFFGAIWGSAVMSYPGSASAEEQGSNSISALPTPSGPDESSRSADYVRKPTDPPPFNPRSAQATAALKREASKRKVAEVPTTDGTTVAPPPGSAKVMTAQLPAAARPAIPIPSTATPPFAPGPATQPSTAPTAAPVTATPFAAPATATPFAAPVTATPAGAPSSETPANTPLTAPPVNPAAVAPAPPAPAGATVVPLYATPVPAAPPESAATPEAATPPGEATPPQGATPPGETPEPAAAASPGATVAAPPPAVSAPAGAPVAAPGGPSEAPQAPVSGQRPSVVGVDSYGQTSAPAQAPPQSAGRPYQPAPTTAPNTATAPTVPPPTTMPPSDMPPAGAAPTQ